MNYYTVKQLAKEFHVSRQAIHQQLNKNLYKNHISKKKINNFNSTVVDKAGYIILKKHFNVDNVVNVQIDKVDNIVDKIDKVDKSKIDKVDKVDNITNADIKAISPNTDKILIKKLNYKIDNLVDKVDKLVDQVDKLVKDIDYFKKSNESLIEALQHEQELHLMDQKQVKTLENKIKELQQPKKKVEEEQQIVEEHKKHWWQFWK